MDSENINHIKQHSTKSAAARTDKYDPFVRGRFPVGVRTIEARDGVRGRLFPIEMWYPADAQYAGQDIAIATQDVFTVLPNNTARNQMAIRNAAEEPGTYPLIIYSHPSGAHRLAATFLCTHLSSHGYIVAALDHSEVVAIELKTRSDESAGQKRARGEAWIANRVPDIRFLLDHLLNNREWDWDIKLDPAHIGIVGHSFGGWTALAATAVDSRIRAVVALAPAGSSHPKPGIIPAKLNFNWGRDVPTLYLVAENDISIPLTEMYELFERTIATKQMVILRRADHLHFVDNVEEMHETVRKMEWTGELAWIGKEMQPIAELCSGEQAHLFVRGLTLCHMDAILKQQEEAQQFLLRDLKDELALRGVDVMMYEL